MTIQFSKDFSDADFPIGKPHPDLIAALQASRDEYGLPIPINGGGRTPEHNAEVGGVPTSEHLMNANGVFRAADIGITDGSIRAVLVPIFLKHGLRVILEPTCTHVDIKEPRPYLTIWRRA